MRLVNRHAALAGALVVLSLSLPGPAAALSTEPPAPPSVEFGELFDAVQMASVFSDQKTFADAIPDEPPSELMADYEKQKQLPAST